MKIMIENEVIHWSDNPILNISNFMAEPNPGIFEDSHSVIKYGFTWVVNSEQLDDQVVFSVENIQLSVEFNPLLSWIRMSEFNDGLLKHEQGHFDLAEIIKRKHQKIFEKLDKLRPWKLQKTLHDPPSSFRFSPLHQTEPVP